MGPPWAAVGCLGCLAPRFCAPASRTRRAIRSRRATRSRRSTTGRSRSPTAQSSPPGPHDDGRRGASRRGDHRPARLRADPGHGRHARALSADPGDRGDGAGAARVAGAADAARGGQDGRPRARHQGRRALHAAARGQRDHVGARVRQPLPTGPERPLRSRGQKRPADRVRPRGLRPQPAPRARGHARDRPRREHEADRALARPRPPALRRHAALQRVRDRGDARRLPDAARRAPVRRCSRAT